MIILTRETHPHLPFWTACQPPTQLYAQGTPESLALLDQLPHRGLAVVGTRNPSSRSTQFLQRCLESFAGENLIIVSGFARGIDAAAHHMALKTGFPTIGILGAGIDIHYPRENEFLRRQILEGRGLLLSEFPPGTPPLPHHFIQRNRLIAASSQAIWVVEAPLRSGALNTAAWAREQNRICLATPCFPGDPLLAGNQLLLDRDHALPVWGPHSFGVAWLELATLQKNVKNPGKSAALFENLQPSESSSGPSFNRYPPLPSLAALLHQVDVLITHQGGADVQTLSNWALLQKWTPLEFYALLQQALEKGLLLEEKGVLLKNSPGSD